MPSLNPVSRRELVRKDYGKLLQYYQEQSRSLVSLKMAPPAGFRAKVMRTNGFDPLPPVRADNGFPALVSFPPVGPADFHNDPDAPPNAPVGSGAGHGGQENEDATTAVCGPRDAGRLAPGPPRA